MRPLRIAAAFTILVTALVFAPAVGGGLIWDDRELVEEGSTSAVEAVTQRYLGVEDIGGYYRPTAKLVLYLTHALAGPAPLAFHLVTLGLHIGAVGLAFAWIATRLRRDQVAIEGSRQAVAVTLAVAFFAIHPARAESAAWISGLTDSLLAVASLLALVAWERRRDARTALAVFVLTFVAMGSKETASVLPLALVTDAWLREHDPAERRRSFGVAAASAAAVGLFWVVRMSLVAVPSNVHPPFGRDWLASVASTIGHYLAHYAMVRPSSMLAASRSVDASGHEVFAPWSVVLGASAVAVVVAWAYRAVKAPASRPWFADFMLGAWFLAPVLNVIPLNLGPLIAERFLYVPAIALACLGARGLVFALGRPRPMPHLVLVAATLVVGLGVVRTVDRIGDFRSEEALFEREHAIAPLTDVPIGFLARYALRRGDADRAIALYLEGYRAGVTLHDESDALESLTAALRLRSYGTSDATVEDLRKLRAFYDALGTGQRAVIALPDLHAGLRLAPSARALLFEDPSEFLIPWAELRSRTGDIDGALALLLAHAPREPSIEVARERMWLHARAGHVADVEREARWLLAHGPQAPEELAAVRTTLAATRVLASPTGASGASRSFLMQANALLAVHAPGLARERLESMRSAAPGARELVLLEARIDAVDGRPDLGRRVIERARDSQPGAGWEQVLEAFDRDTASVARRR